MPTPVRLQRIAERIQFELSNMLIKEINDPRLRQVFITDVRVDREFTLANIYVSALEGKSRSAEVLQGLYAASGFIRYHLAERVELRAFPRLKFHWDPTPENADHIEKLFAEIRNEKAEVVVEKKKVVRKKKAEPVTEKVTAKKVVTKKIAAKKKK